MTAAAGGFIHIDLFDQGREVVERHPGPELVGLDRDTLRNPSWRIAISLPPSASPTTVVVVISPASSGSQP